MDKFIFYCKMCKEDKKHMELDWQPEDSSVRFKCMSCGEYNSPLGKKTVAEEIMEPLENILKDLVQLAQASVEIPVNSTRVNAIVRNMDGALTSVRRNVESLLEATMPPDDYYDKEEENLPGGNNYRIIEAGVKQLVKYGDTDLFENYASEEDLSSVVDMTTHRGEEK